MPVEEIYIYSAVGIIIIVLLYIAYTVFKTKRIIQKEIENENKNPAY